MRPLVFLSITILTGIVSSSCASFANYLDSTVVKSYKQAPYRGAIPRRPENAPTGSAFIKSINSYNEAQREQAIVKEIRRGNIPNFLRQLVPIRLDAKFGQQFIQATVWVMPDYLAIGSDDDYVRLPMNPISAQRIADHFGYSLPTPKIVDAIYEQATIVLKPQPLPPSPAMVSTEYYWRHQLAIEKTLDGRGKGSLVAGHKKDVVISNILDRRAKRVAIYGWHRLPKLPIQPLSTAHHDRYADYSHGIRLVANTAVINGEERPLVEVLKDPAAALALSYEGVLNKIRIATGE